MDDCDLEKLSIKPGKLTPAFNRKVTEYNVTLASTVDKLTFDPLTSDSGASYSISGSGGSKTVPLKEGEVTDIKIEVTSEDGTIKNYFIHAKRLSGKDASLNDIKISIGWLHPGFSPEILEYTCVLPCQVASVKVTPTAPDPKSEVLLNGNKPGEDITLCVGETRAEIQVTSPDGSNKKTYIVDLIRKPLPRYVKFVDPKKALEFECPISLSPLYRPITVKDSVPKHTYSAPFIDAETRTSKVDPLSGQALPADWRIVDRELEKQMSAEMATIPLTYGGSIEPVKFAALAGQLEKCNVAPKVEDPKDRFQKSAFTAPHTVESRKWEKQLQQVFDENDSGKLSEAAQNYLTKYYASLPATAQGYKQFNEGESPTDYLQHAIHCYATAIKFKPKDANLHFQLAMILEEKYYVEDMFGLKKESHDDMPSFNVQARESSKEEEVLAICKLRGVPAGAPVSLQLKAIDEEYHHLLDSGQGGKADHVQGLYAWYSKKVSQEGAAAHKAEDSENPLGQAFLKYMDAMTMDESKAIYNFHVGRLLFTQGNYDDAVLRLEAALCWNSQHQLSRIYLGLALSLRKNGPGDRLKECVRYLLESMEVLLTDLSKQAATPDENMMKQRLYADDLIRPTNVHMLRGIIQLGKLLAANQDIKEAMAPGDVFHTAAVLASRSLPTVYKADVYKQLEWVLLDAHAVLLEMLSAAGKDEELIAQRCERLSALIQNSTIPQNQQLIDLQERTSQNLVQIQPCSSHALFLLGSSQLNKYDNSSQDEEAKKLLQDAKSSFQASIELQGKPAEGEVPELVSAQAWYQQRQKAEEEKKKAAAAKAAPAPAAKQAAPAGRGGGVAGRGTTPAAARGKATPAPAGRGAPVAAAGRGAPGAKGRGAPTPAAAGRGGAAAAKPGAKSPPATESASGKATAGSKTGHKCEATPPPASQPKPKPAQPPEPAPAAAPASSDAAKSKKPAPMNVKTYYPYLGLARVYRALDDHQQAKKYYDEVAQIAPDVHDAYIESADMLVKADPLSAVDVYCNFPVSENPTFDDAYIFGEIIRILMKHEKYDDPRLSTNMIAYGKILGLGALDRYVKILEEKFKNKLLQTVYAGVNGKSVDDPDMQNFFKFKCWI